MVSSAFRPPEAKRRVVLEIWLIGALALLLILLALFSVVLFPRLIYPPLSDSELDQAHVSNNDMRMELKENRLKIQNDARTTLMQGIGALLVLVGAGIGTAVSLRQLKVSRDQLLQTQLASQEELRLTREGQITDRFSRAVDQLGSDKLDVRLGGIYGLERIARDSSKDRGPVTEILTTYVREHSPWPPVHQPKDTPGLNEGGTRSVRIRPSSIFPLRSSAPDVQAAMTVLGRRPTSVDGTTHSPPAAIDGRYSLGLGNVDLRYADLRGANLEGAWLLKANLQKADLAEAKLRGAMLHYADLRVAFLVGADLTNADLRKADLRGAWAHEADFRGAKLAGADLRGAILGDAVFDGADITDVLFDSATTLRGQPFPTDESSHAASKDEGSP
jgi:hypothetical protein